MDDVFLDLNYDEDSAATADFNFVITQSNKIIEMQGGAESCSYYHGIYLKKFV